MRGLDQLRCGVVEVGGGSSPLIVSDRVGADGKAEEREIPLPDKVVELPYRAATNGWVRREISFRQATDGLADDDRLFDAFLATPEIPVYLLEPHPERDVFLQTTFFLNQALRPTAGDAAADSRSCPRWCRCRRRLKSCVPWKAARPWWWCRHWQFGRELPAAVEAFLRQGGGVVFFAGPELQPASYAAAWRDMLPALPGEVLPVEISPALAPIEATHPIWGEFSEELRKPCARCR